MKAVPLVRSVAIAGFLGIVIAGAVAWWARFRAPFRVQVRQVVVRLPRRHQALAGLTIAFVTDTHVGPHFPASRLDPALATLRAMQPDLVIFGGDYISESPRFLHDAIPILARMAATGHYGAWAILGNHDMANSRTRVIPALEAAGIPVLVNAAARLRTDRGELWLVGIDDGLLGEPALDAAFATVPPGAAAICLWHEPDRVQESAPYGAFLQLSGHTHGGQVRVPLVGPLAAPKLGQEYVQGLFEVGDMLLYVSAGLGVYRPPVRLNCAPELTIVRLID